MISNDDDDDDDDDGGGGGGGGGGDDEVTLSSDRSFSLTIVSLTFNRLMNSAHRFQKGRSI